MNKEDYVSLEVAKLLKKEGYEYVTSWAYNLNRNNFELLHESNVRLPNYLVSAPTLYEAQKWLRNERNIFIVIIPHYVCDYEIVEYEYRISTYIDLMEQPCKWISSLSYYEYYEECLNAGILAALKMIDHETKTP